MPQKLAYLHTVTSLVTLFNQLSKELLPPEVEVFHIADEMLLKLALAQGGLSPFIYRRVADHVSAAEAFGASAVQFTCSSISPCADASRPLVSIPLLKVDEPMVDQAIAVGERVGVAATALSTLKPTTDLVHARAALAGKKVQVDSVLAEGAFAALMSGDTETHDRIVRDTLEGLMSRNQVVVLAQASMARILEAMAPEARSVPVLSSPRLAVERAAKVLSQM
jgi:Asp/Glu/hydantoin racemase